MNQEIFLLLGSNMRDRKKILSNAIREIEKCIGSILLRSSVYQSEPWGFKSQNQFFNQIVKVKTGLHPEGVLREIKNIENLLGRKGDLPPYSDRIIDIDIIFIGNKIMTTKFLTVPHEKFHIRRFALVPMAEIAGNFIHPVFNKTVFELLKECKDNGKVEININ